MVGDLLGLAWVLGNQLLEMECSLGQDLELVDKQMV